MKTIYIAKIDCLYLWCTASETFEECRQKATEILNKEKKNRCTISHMRLESIESFLLL